MSTLPTPAPTSGTSPTTAGAWTPIGGDRSIYTYSFLGAIAFLTAVVLFFVMRSHIRRRRFAIRVQQALDSGRLNPNIVDEITSLPSGALYFSRPKKQRKHKVKPRMYEIQLGDGWGRTSSDTDDGYGHGKKGQINWNEINPIAVSRLASPLQHNELIANPHTLPTPSISINSTAHSQTGIHADTQHKTALHTTSQINRVALSVFISMPSPSSKDDRGNDAEDIVPDICLGVTQVDMISVEQASIGLS